MDYFAGLDVSLETVSICIVMRVASHNLSGWVGSGKFTSKAPRRNGYACCWSTVSSF